MLSGQSQEHFPKRRQLFLSPNRSNVTSLCSFILARKADRLAKLHKEIRYEATSETHRKAELYIVLLTLTTV